MCMFSPRSSVCVYVSVARRTLSWPMFILDPFLVGKEPSSRVHASGWFPFHSQQQVKGKPGEKTGVDLFVLFLQFKVW